MEFLDLGANIKIMAKRELLKEKIQIVRYQCLPFKA